MAARTASMDKKCRNYVSVNLQINLFTYLRIVGFMDAIRHLRGHRCGTHDRATVRDVEKKYDVDNNLLLRLSMLQSPPS